MDPTFPTVTTRSDSSICRRVGDVTAAVVTAAVVAVVPGIIVTGVVAAVEVRVREAAGAVEMTGIANAVEVGARARLGGRATGTMALVILAAHARRAGVLALGIGGAGVRALPLPEPRIARQL